MRICICGLHRESAVKKAENKFGVESININFPGMENNDYNLFYHAAETFKHFYKNKNVVFDGGVFDDFKFYSDQGWIDLQEQVIMSAIENVDEMVIITEGMDEKRIDFCNSFAELYPSKIKIIHNENMFN